MSTIETEALRIQPASWTQPIELDGAFPVRQPLDVDLGCGKGRFLAARAARHPERNLLGVERLLVRIRKVERKLARAGLDNVRLLRIEASYAVARLLPPRSVSTYFIFFPDPWPKRRHHRRRLLAPPFLDAVARTLRPGGDLYVATDHLDYHAHIERLFAEHGAFDAIPPYEPEEDEHTDFELIFMAKGAPIGRSGFRLRDESPPVRRPEAP